MIKIGDRVKFINDVYVGEVKSIHNAIANVEVEDGFVVPAVISELVAVDEEEERHAVERIGIGDERPGTKGKRAQKKQKEEKPRKVSALSRYGKVTLLSEEEDDEGIDLNAIREQYLRQVVALNNKDLEKEKNRENIHEMDEKEVVPEQSHEKSTVSKEQKMHQVTLSELGKELGLTESKPIAQANTVKKSRVKNNEPEVIDLHIEEILENTEGMSPGEILSAQLSRFTIALDSAILSGKHGKMIFIHGVGSGKLKYELQKKLKLKYPKLSYQDASFREYGYGAILVFY